MKNGSENAKNAYVIKHISTENPMLQDTVTRLYELGLSEGLSFEIIQKISLNSVTILQFDNAILALNKEEMSCLKY